MKEKIMNALIKKIVIGLCIIIILAGAGYIGYRIYNNAVEDATRRIKEGVREGVSEGIGEGIGSALNPLNIPGKLFGRK